MLLAIKLYKEARMEQKIPCDMCHNDFGEQRMVEVKLDGQVEYINVCHICGQNKTDFEVFKIIYPLKFRGS